MSRHRGLTEFRQAGWTRLPFRFDQQALDTFSKLEPHVGRGRRLTDMIELSNTLPDGFKKSLAEFGFNASPLRAVGFNKSSDLNWSLPWHQDRVIAVPHKTDAPEFKNWSRKSGVWHCEPPAFVLEQIAFAYIVFDDVKDGMGGLELAERSHRHGIVPEKNIEKFVNHSKIVCPSMVTGDVLLVSAMTLHRSALIKTDMRRRALRVDFGATALNLSK